MFQNVVRKLLVALMATMLAGCSLGGSEAEVDVHAVYEPPAMPQEMQDEEQEESMMPPEAPERGEATEIDRGGEEYDYSGWEIMPTIEICFLIAKEWSCPVEFDQDSDMSFSTIWTDAAGSQIVFRSNVQSTPAPADAVMEIVNALLDEGVNLEYGDFQREYMEAASYYRRVDVAQGQEDEKEYWDAQIFFTDWVPEGRELKTTLMLSLKLAESSYVDENAISMENFFKMANTILISYFLQDTLDYYYELTGMNLPNYWESGYLDTNNAENDPPTGT